VQIRTHSRKKKPFKKIQQGNPCCSIINKKYITKLEPYREASSNKGEGKLKPEG
jgi:hypothetical protein